MKGVRTVAHRVGILALYRVSASLGFVSSWPGRALFLPLHLCAPRLRLRGRRNTRAGLDLLPCRCAQRRAPRDAGPILEGPGRPLKPGGLAFLGPDVPGEVGMQGATRRNGVEEPGFPAADHRTG